MSAHELAFTLLTSASDDQNVVLSTQKVYRDQAGVVWVETAEGRVRQSDLDRATRGLTRGDLTNRYGESLTGDRALDEKLQELLTRELQKELDSNKAAIANKATITLPVEDAREFKVGTWYRLRFEEMDPGVSLRSLITNVVHDEETVAVQRQQSAERPTDTF